MNGRKIGGRGGTARVEELLRLYPLDKAALKLAEQNASNTKRTCTLVKHRTEVIEYALSLLTPDEKSVIEEFFFTPTPDTPELCWQLGIERATLYRIRARALLKMEQILYCRGKKNF